jgi:hypothetical protein
MESRVIGRGALAGFVAGLLGFVFARIFAEPLIDKAIAYENGRGEILDKLNTAAGRVTEAEGPEVFSRAVQSSIGMASAIVGFATAMGALLAVAYLVVHGRFRVRPQTTVWLLAGFGFLGVFLLPFVKYPANPPAVGHDFTVTTRGHLYVTMVTASLVLLGVAAYAARALVPRLGLLRSVMIAAFGFLVAYGLLIGLLPSLGNLAANKDHVDQFGFARAATETPQPITNILDRPLQVDGHTVAPGQLVYPGFDADVLWKFRWYSVLEQLIIWTGTALIFGALLDRFVGGRPLRRSGRATRQPAAVG